MQLQATVVDLQRFKVVSDQLQLKVESLERRLTLRDNEMAEARAAARGAITQMEEARTLTVSTQRQASSVEVQLRQELDAATAASATSEQKAAEAAAQLESRTTLLEETQQALQEHVDMCGKLRTELATALQDNESLTVQVQEQQHLEDFHRNERDDLEHRCGVLQRQVESLEQELKRIKTDDVVALRDKAKQAGDAQVQLISLKSELRSVTAALTAERTNREALEEAKDHIVQSNKDMQLSLAELSTSQAQLAAVSEELSHTRAALDSRDADVARLRRELDAARSARDAAVESGHAASTSAAEARAEADAERRRADDAERRHHAVVDSEVDGLRRRADGAEQQVALERAHREAAEQDAAAAKAQLREAQQAVLRLQSELRDATLVKDVETQALRTEVASLTATATTVSELRVRLQRSEEQCRLLQRQATGLHASAAATGVDAVRGLHQRITDLIQQKGYLSNTVRSLQRLHKDACDLAAALRCKWSAGLRAAGRPSLRTAVVAVMAANRLRKYSLRRQAGGLLLFGGGGGSGGGGGLNLVVVRCCGR